jgi:hypothetical protein
MLKLTAISDASYLDELAAAIEIEALDRMELAYRQVGQEVVDYLRSLAEPPIWRPPLIRSKKTGRLYQARRLGMRHRPDTQVEGPRRAHPGEWADRSGQLALSYSFEVIREAHSVSLVFRNTAEYALYVEEMDGFFVLSGVTDPGGPVEVAFRAIAARLFPDWRIVNSGVVALTAEATP